MAEAYVACEKAWAEITADELAIDRICWLNRPTQTGVPTIKSSNTIFPFAWPVV